MGKIFLLNPQKQEVDSRWVAERSDTLAVAELTHASKKADKLSDMPNLKAVEGTVVIQIDTESKNSWTFSNGQKIRYERQFDNFNRRQTEPVNATVIDGYKIKKGTDILIHPNAIAEHYRILDCGKRELDEIRYYAIPEDMCFCYREGEEWLPLKPYEKALRIFKPYTGVIQGIEPTEIKDHLYVLTGDLKGKVVLTLKASDYEIIFQGTNGKEQSLIRFRPNGDGKEREPEAIAISHEYTKNVERGTLLVGYTTSDCKPISNKYDRKTKMGKNKSETQDGA